MRFRLTLNYYKFKFSRNFALLHIWDQGCRAARAYLCVS